MRPVRFALMVAAACTPVARVAAQSTPTFPAQQIAPSILVTAERPGAFATVRWADRRLRIEGDSIFLTGTAISAADAAQDLILEAAAPGESVVLSYTPRGAAERVRVVASRITLTRDAGSQDFRLSSAEFRIK